MCTIYTHAHAHTHAHARTCARTHTDTRTHRHTHAHTHTKARTRARAHTHTNTHTQTRTHTHTVPPAAPLSPWGEEMGRDEEGGWVGGWVGAGGAGTENEPSYAGAARAGRRHRRAERPPQRQRRSCSVWQWHLCAVEDDGAGFRSWRIRSCPFPRSLHPMAQSAAWCDLPRRVPPLLLHDARGSRWFHPE
jgi:hypothetical protein